ncbi:MAG: aconitate hydratase [Deltaproteobacteria bacterium]|nr:aconitate hydratase [Deltaproteobacteria bacterium]
MGENLTRKLLKAHLVEGELVPGKEIAVRMDHVLLQDATGTMAMLSFEALGLERVRAERCVQYVDHNLLQTDHKNADDHLFLQTACARFGILYSRPGNGVSHQVHMERFGVPGKTMIGADSHTPGAAGVSMLAIGAGGLDAALAMAGYPYHLPCPKVLGVKLAGALPEWVSAKDVILEMLRRRGVNGCLGTIIEYYGPGVASLSATDRETIGNMGAETGATTSIFPSDENTRAYLVAQGRGSDWTPLAADEGATYDERDEIDLSKLEPLIACPQSPGNVVPVREVAGTAVHQVIVGSSVNSSFRDLTVTARILEGRTVHPNVTMHINPGSRQVLLNVLEQGGALSLLKSGAIVNEPGCLGCIGMGQAPGTGQVSLRTFPRNFPGRSGTKDDRVYLCSPETAAAAALKGMITDPRDLGKEIPYPRAKDPERYLVETSAILSPPADGSSVEILRGPNIKRFPDLDALPEELDAEVTIVVGDDVSTDTIMPAGAQVLPLRSNIEAISQHVFSPIASDVPARCRAAGKAVVVAGENYGQGSSREHAALAPRYLGVRAKIAKSFARIHRANLVNYGIVPLLFENPADYGQLKLGAKLRFPELRKKIAAGERRIPVEAGGKTFTLLLEATERERNELVAGGTLNYVRKHLIGAEGGT